MVRCVNVFIVSRFSFFTSSTISKVMTTLLLLVLSEHCLGWPIVVVAGGPLFFVHEFESSTLFFGDASASHAVDSSLPV